MKELRDIVKAFDAATKAGKKTALATVVYVEGSSYRRPGARMLITEDGLLTGAISGGCLEGDALRKALAAMESGHNKLVTYDTTDDDDIQFGVQLGCNGIVHILFEPIDVENAIHPLHMLRHAALQETPAVLVTLFSLAHSNGPQPGTVLLYSGEIQTLQSQEAQLFQTVIYRDAAEALTQQTSFLKTYLADEKTVQGFVEYLKPAPALVIAGAGNDAQPVVQIAALLGWKITVVDGRATHATTQRFPNADSVIIAKGEAVLQHVPVTAQTIFVLMTHNYNYDLAVLRQLLQQNVVPYIGVLGPKKKLQRMLTDLEAGGLKPEHEDLKKLFGPMGLDIGAETAEEIAISIIAEIQMVLEKRNGRSLRDKRESIHAAPEVTASQIHTGTLASFASQEKDLHER
jgi:xanthine dehydrogenase accessory factor